MYKNSFNVQKLIQCSKTHSMYKNSFNVQKLIQCSKTHSMFKNSFNVQKLIQCVVLIFYYVLNLNQSCLDTTILNCFKINICTNFIIYMLVK